jgi:hypothetical protein
VRRIFDLGYRAIDPSCGLAVSGVRVATFIGAR